MLLVLSMLVTVGCAHRQYDQPQAERTSLPPEDAASLRRVWPRQEALYTDTRVEAGPRGFNYGSDPSRPQYQNQAFEPVNFVWQAFWLPVDLIVNPQSAAQSYNTQPTETTFTAASVPLDASAPAPANVLPPAPGPASGSPAGADSPAPQTGDSAPGSGPEPGSPPGQGGPPGSDRPGSETPAPSPAGGGAGR